MSAAGGDGKFVDGANGEYRAKPTKRERIGRKKGNEDSDGGWEG